MNAGFRVSLAAGSRKGDNRTLLGAWRTFADLNWGKRFSFEAWIEAIRRGRTFITSGPLLTVHVNGERPGITHVTGDSSPLKIHFGAYSLEPIERTELIANGKVVATGQNEEVGITLDLPAGGWLAVRCWQNGRITAHTSPQYIQIEGVPTPVDQAAVAFLDGNLIRAREWVESEGRFDNPKSREHLLGIFDAARESLRNASPKRRETDSGSVQ